MNGITIDDIYKDSVMYKGPYYYISSDGEWIASKRLKIEK